MHAFAKMPHNMLKFVPTNTFSGKIGEQVLKGIVKDHPEKTQGDQINLQNNLLYASMKAILSNIVLISKYFFRQHKGTGIEGNC